MPSAKGTSWYRELTVEQARPVRIDQARLARADRAEPAERTQAAGQVALEPPRPIPRRAIRSASAAPRSGTAA